MPWPPNIARAVAEPAPRMSSRTCATKSGELAMLAGVAARGHDRPSMPTLDAASATSVELRQQAESARRNGQIGEAVALAERALARAQGDAVETALAQLELGNLL